MTLYNNMVIGSSPSTDDNSRISNSNINDSCTFTNSIVDYSVISQLSVIENSNLYACIVYPNVFLKDSNYSNCSIFSFATNPYCVLISFKGQLYIDYLTHTILVDESLKPDDLKRLIDALYFNKKNYGTVQIGNKFLFGMRGLVK